MAVGNHEFDDGPDVLREFMDRVSFPVLMANADVSKEPAERFSKKSDILSVGGQKLV